MKTYINKLLVTIMFVLPLGNAIARPFILCVEQKKCGIMDTEGYWIIDPIYERIFTPGKNGVAIYGANLSPDNSLLGTALGSQNGQYGLLNTITKREITKPLYDQIFGFAENGLAATKKNGKYGYIDKSGVVAIPFKYDFVNSFAKNGLACVRNGKKYGYINSMGKEVIPLQFDNCDNFSDNGLAAVGINDRYGYINSAGAVIIPLQFEDAGTFSKNGLANVKMKGNYGYINKAGAVIIPMQYSFALPFYSNGLAQVKVNGRYSYIDAAGVDVTPADIEDLSSFSKNGFALVKRNGEYAFIDSKGKFVMEGYIEADEKGLDVFGLKSKNGSWGVYDILNQKKVATQYEKYKGVNNVVLNKEDKVIWPKDYAQLRSKFEAQENLEIQLQNVKKCESVYQGKVGTLKGKSYLSIDVQYVVRYVNTNKGMATIEATSSGQLNMNRGEMKEISCEDL